MKLIRHTPAAFFSRALSLLGILSWLGMSFMLAGQTRTTKSSRADDLYRRNCARCHGAEGRGDTPLGKTLNAPDFTDTDWWQKHSEITSSKNLAAIINHGKGGMPAFGKKLTRTEINLLVGYVRKFRNQSR